MINKTVNSGIIGHHFVELIIYFKSHYAKLLKMKISKKLKFFFFLFNSTNVYLLSMYQ